jgi:hypothetical protein
VLEEERVTKRCERSLKESLAAFVVRNANADVIEHADFLSRFQGRLTSELNSRFSTGKSVRSKPGLSAFDRAAHALNRGNAASDVAATSASSAQ